jgi:hypothetical protein
MLRVGPPEVIVQVPRRGRGGARSLEPAQQAMVVTTALLNILLGLSLPRAAAAVGVSLTALKHASRKLGLARWDYWDYHLGPDRRPAPGGGRSGDGRADTQAG